MKSLISLKNLPYIFIFYYDIYEKTLNSLTYKDE